MAYMRLGDLLVASGVINEEQLAQGLQYQKGSGKRLGDTMIEHGIITEQQLIEALQVQLGVDFVDLTSLSIPIELAKLVPKNIANEYKLVPVKLDRDSLYIAMSDPLDFVGQEEAKSASKKKIIPMIATRRAVEQSISLLYGNEGTARGIEEMRREAGSTTQRDFTVAATVENTDDNTDANPTIRFINNIIERAFTERCSDIHLEPQENGMVVRMRIDGSLRKILTVPANLQSAVISRIKVIGGMNISEHRIPQDGHAMMIVKAHNIDLRINSLPTVYGEKIVIRILDKTSWNISKNSIGLEGDDMKKYENLLKNSSGVILIVGPTGSGKSTTMCAMISELAGEEVNVITLEDPVEYNIAGVNQCQINEKTGMTFAVGLRAILRQDPDIIGVGEIRDGETATIAVRAAITGHLVLSTLHTNDAVSAVSRLEDIGVEPYMVSAALRGVISQRLVRKLCPHCKKPYKPEPIELEQLGMDPDTDTIFYRPEGCPECNHVGYSGRRAVFEILTLTGKLRSMIVEGANEGEIVEAAKQQGFVKMIDRCRSLVERGVTSVNEAMRAINSTAD